MALFGVWNLGHGSRHRLRAGVAVASIGLCWVSAQGKEPSLTAIELYDGAAGPAYVQLADVLINGKAELRNCATSGAGAIDKSEYGKLAKVGIAPGGVLERGQDGMLRYSSGDGDGFCVVPENVKFEHGASFTAAAIADAVDLRARALSAGSEGVTAAQQLKKGVKLVFVAAADPELAEFLLAQRGGTQADWQNYLSKYPAAAHTDAGKQALSGLYIAAGEKALAAYRKSANADAPSYADLKTARAQVNLAHLLLTGSPGEEKLAGGVRAEVGALTDRAKAELDAYTAALTGGTAGYVHLRKAKALVEAVAGVDGTFAPLGKVRDGVTAAAEVQEVALHSAEQAAAAKKWDESVKLVQPYRAFANEEPRIARVIDDAYSAYYVQAQQLDATKEWKGAIENYEQALKAKETPEAKDGLKAAQKQFEAAQDDAAAKAALDKSKTLELQKDMILAYEALTGLSPSQQVLVKDDIARLEPAYVTAASQRAKMIAGAYPTIGGIGDEKAVENAYALLERAEELSTEDGDKQGFRLRMQNLSDELSAWFLERAKHSLQKPAGSETELGWSYLKEAEAYKAGNLEAVLDQIKEARPAHEMHSKLSIRVTFRDQTPQRLGGGFANQMESAIATELDRPGMGVKVIRSTDVLAPELVPDFAIAGDVLERSIIMPESVDSVDSKWVAGVQQKENPEWNKLNRQYEAAGDELRTAQAALQAAKGKKVVSEATRQVNEAQDKVNELRNQLDNTTKSTMEDIYRPYAYKRTTYNVVNRIGLQFRIDDELSGQKGEPEAITKEEKTKFVVTSDVKPEDANKARNEGTTPDKEQMQNELENQAREELIKKVAAKVVELPGKIYQDAQKREQDGYADDAGEAYMRFLNVATPDQVTERAHAEKFLREQFNFKVFPGHVRESPRAVPAVEQGMAKQ